MLEDIITKIKKENEYRVKRGLKTISEDDTNEEILLILKDYFLYEFIIGQDIDSIEFLESKFGAKAELIREAEAGFY